MKRPLSPVTRAAAPTAATAAARAMDATHLDPRLTRVRRLAWLMDRSIPIGGGRRIGLDPLLGLWPGAGDALGAVISLYVVYEGARLGLPLRVLGRMLGNILVEAVAGTVPLVGDVFDAVWGANMRNVRLVDQHYRPERPDRPSGRIITSLVIVAVLLIALVLTASAFVIAGLWRLFSA
jgi:hypothetical protein